MPSRNNRTHRGKSKQQRLKPRQNTLSQRTGKEKMLQGFHRSPTKARERNRQPERPETLRCIKDPTSNLSTQVDHLSIQIEKQKGTPSGPPIKSTKDPSKLLHTMFLFRTKGTGNRPWYSRLTQGNRHERKTRHRRRHQETPKKTHPDRVKQEEETYRRVARLWGHRNTARKERQGGRHQNES